MIWFKKEMLLLTIIFIALTSGVKKVFAIEKANEDQKTTLLESKNNSGNPFSDSVLTGTYSRDLVTL